MPVYVYHHDSGAWDHCDAAAWYVATALSRTDSIAGTGTTIFNELIC